MINATSLEIAGLVHHQVYRASFTAWQDVRYSMADLADLRQMSFAAELSRVSWEIRETLRRLDDPF